MLLSASAALLLPHQAEALTPPQFIQEAETTWNDGTTPKTTATFDVRAGDILVAFAVAENDEDNATPLTILGGSLTWTQRQEVDISDSNWAYVSVWTATVDTDKTMSVTFAREPDASVLFGGNVLTFRGSSGVGASNKTNVASGAPTLNLTTTQANSAVVVVNGDWNAADGASRTWLTNAGAFTEQTYFRSSSPTRIACWPRAANSSSRA